MLTYICPYDEFSFCSYDADGMIATMKASNKAAINGCAKVSFNCHSFCLLS